MPAAPLRVLLSFAAVQGVLDPITPLGRDLFGGLVAGAGRLLGYQLVAEEAAALREAGKRLWIDVTGLVNTRPGCRIVLAALAYVEPSGQQVLDELARAGELPAAGRHNL